ncbi:syndetin-like isoform X2 [Pecten maximus]|uniref:syndetin-like isoform X2 n=1 Tax=Pecten maximus TaxID=6579 RepID=UPI0014588386|nr:syndetin-like isoform X2 [Pecten maximus]
MAVMDIKRKFQNLLRKQESVPSPVEEDINHDLFTGEPAIAKYKHSHVVNPHEEQEVLENIEEVYFNNRHVDTSEYELQKVPENPDLDQIDRDRQKLRKQLQVVSKKVSDLVLQNHPAYATELQRVMELQKTLQLASIICANGRRQLSGARKSFTTASLKMLANYRKRQQLIGLLKSLRTIKTLQRTDLRLREMMEEEDYCSAIQLCLECQKAASTFKHFTCISELSSKLQDTLEMIEEQLDVALSKTCSHFDVVHYEKVQIAYRLLDKTQTAMDQLHMHFTSAIHSTAFQIVLGYVELCSGTGDSNFQKRSYVDLCKNITQESFKPCLVDLCKALWEVMKSYHKTILWHESHDEEFIRESGVDVDISLKMKYIRQKLDHGLTRIWHDVQQKVKIYILGTDMANFKLEDFIRVLDLVNRLIEIGEEFCGSKSEGLQDSLKQQSLNYFKNHHRYRMDELGMFLENEGWEICPVKSNFTLLQLLEFRFMKSWTRSPTTNSLVNSQYVAEGEESLPNGDHRGGGERYFDQYKDEGSPFDVQPDEEENEDVFSGSWDDEDGGGSDTDSDEPDELKQDYIDELTGEAQSNRQFRRRISRNKNQRHIPIVTNTTLNVLRVIGKYMQMMTVLKPIAFDVINCMSQLFEYYLYTVHIFFGADTWVMNERSLNNRLHLTLQRIRNNLIAETPVPGAPPTDPENGRDKIPQPHLSPIVDLSGSGRLFGLAERVVAAESLVFLASQMELLYPHLEAMIPGNKKVFLQQFFSQTVKMAAELRKPVYWTVSVQAVDYDNILHHMSGVKWDVKDIMSQHNSYVDVMLKSLEQLSVRLVDINRRVPIPKVVYDLIWEHCVRLSNRTIVEGYAGAKKCSNEGRALMQLDFQQFLSKLETIVDLRPIPEREYVEAYIKAYYLPESQMDSWILEHKEYSNKQLLSLINSVDHINKKARQRLIATVEDMDRQRR